MTTVVASAPTPSTLARTDPLWRAEHNGSFLASVEGHAVGPTEGGVDILAVDRPPPTGERCRLNVLVAYVGRLRCIGYDGQMRERCWTIGLVLGAVTCGAIVVSCSKHDASHSEEKPSPPSGLKCLKVSRDRAQGRSVWARLTTWTGACPRIISMLQRHGVSHSVVPGRIPTVSCVAYQRSKSASATLPSHRRVNRTCSCGLAVREPSPPRGLQRRLSTRRPT